MCERERRGGKEREGKERRRELAGVCMYRKESSLLVLRCWWLMKFRPSSGVQEAGSCPHICWYERFPHLLSELLPGFTCCSGKLGHCFGTITFGTLRITWL